MFETLIREAAGRFNLGDNAGRFVRLLIDAIFDDDNGGFTGLRDRFANAGLGGLFASWIGDTPGDNALQPDQFAAGFGSNAIGNIAGKLGIPNSAVTAAGAFLLPKIVGALTPGGTIPTASPGLDGLLGNVGATLGGLGSEVRHGVGAAAAGVGAAAAGIGNAARDGVGAAAHGVGSAARGVERAAGGGFWKWLIPLLLLVGAFFLFKGCMKHDAEPAVDAAATTSAEPATDAAAGDAANAAGTADAGATAPVGETAAEGTDGAAATIGTDAAATGTDAAAANADPNAAADAALSGVKAGASVDDVLKALNLMIIHFATGSANISADSDAILQKAAAAIKSLPAGTKLEVGGHTDNTGNAAKNQTLSQQRADAVVARLGELGVAAGTLSGKGYGQDQPKADNATAEGRAQNRRIEFTAAK